MNKAGFRRAADLGVFQHNRPVAALQIERMNGREARESGPLLKGVDHTRTERFPTPLGSVGLRPARAARRSDSRAGKWLHWHDLDADGPALCGANYCLLRGIDGGYTQERERTAQFHKTLDERW